MWYSWPNLYRYHERFFFLSSFSFWWVSKRCMFMDPTKDGPTLEASWYTDAPRCILRKRCSVSAYKRPTVRSPISSTIQSHKSFPHRYIQYSFFFFFQQLSTHIETAVPHDVGARRSISFWMHARAKTCLLSKSTAHATSQWHQSNSVKSERHGVHHFLYLFCYWLNQSSALNAQWLAH